MPARIFSSQELQSRINAAATLLEDLSECFNTLASGNLEDIKLSSVTTAVLGTFDLSKPAADVSRDMDLFQGGVRMEEANLLLEAAEQAQRRIRLLLKTPRESYGLSVLGDDGTFDDIKPAVEADKQQAHEHYVPYATALAGQLTKVADVLARRDAVVQEGSRLNSIFNRALSDTETRQFYAGYADMSYDTLQDFAENTSDLADTHINIAHICMSRMSLMMAQLWLEKKLNKSDADTAALTRSIAEVRTRANNHLNGWDSRGVAVFGAWQYENIGQILALRLNP
ncbi:MAG: hypothetical protein KGQ41_02380 [Alphaproteobacteria bacterium]|nr:hypothetical protein [Alphaproteobacteria bacterium]